jgi:dTDP-4-amino-4,6-dideoxygalactose transaminase
MTTNIPFNRPYMTGKELANISEAKLGNMLAGDGPFTKRCHTWLESNTGCNKALLTHSCTAALELAALLLDIEPGDEVIMPAYTFTSTANAFVLRGAVPVFVDIRADTLNLDDSLIESAITPRTRAIIPVHYAGVACEMDSILSVAKKYDVRVIEDAAQGVMAKYKGQVLGSIGDLGTYSFHETKNVISGEGGALLVNDQALGLRAEIIREKGTDRSRFFRGEVDKYTWQEVGSSFLPGEITAAFLWAQLEEAQRITNSRLEIWSYYHKLLKPLEHLGVLRRPIVPSDCEHNAHLYYVLLSEQIARDKVLDYLKKSNISAVFHYVPLHSSPAGMKYGRNHGNLSITSNQSRRLIRLPMWVGLSNEQQERIVDTLTHCLTDSV